jgi:glycosyltransferase involved in cell wall biosynthesis
LISVLILTKNEEVNITRCIASVQWSNDIVVFDSLSTDRTVELATAAGARVIQHPFVDYGSQREAARQVGYHNPWVLAVDADEQPDAELVAEMQRAVEANPNAAAFRMRRKDYFQGRWIKHCTLYPSWFLRLYRPDRIRYEPRAVHEYPTVDGTVGELTGHLIHDNFSKGLEDWYHRHVQYAALEGAENIRVLNDPSSKLDLLGLISISDPVRRRRALKSLAMRLPCRPLLRFAYMYVLRGGFLDGAAGLEYCRMIAGYERMIVSFMRDARNRADVAQS